MNRLLCQWAGGLLLATLLLQPAGAVDVRAIRLWAGPDSTRVVVDLSGTAQHSLLHAAQSRARRVSTSRARTSPSLAPRAPGTGAIREVRMSHSPAGNFRLVLDLARPIQAKSFLSAPNARYGYRLVVDLGGAGRVADKPVKVRHAPSVVRHAPSDARYARSVGGMRRRMRAISSSPSTPATAARTQVPSARTARARRTWSWRSRVNWRSRSTAEPGMKAVLTRSGDYFVPLRDRMRRARAQQADLFVSIHADSHRDRSVDGSSVYILSQRGATDEASRWLAERENASDLIGGVSLGRQGRCAGLRAARSVAIGVVERERGGGRARAAPIDSGRRGSQARGAAGALRGAEVA